MLRFIFTRLSLIVPTFLGIVFLAFILIHLVPGDPVLDVSDRAVALTELSGQVAGTVIGGRLAVGLSQPTTLDGDIRLSKANLPALIAATVGMPGKRGEGGDGWPAEPFGGGLFAGSTGRVVVTSADTQLTPKLASRDLHGTVQVEPSKVTLDDFQGALAGGTIAGRLT